MAYSIIGILAALVLVIVNHDALRPAERQSGTPAHRTYRAFLLGIMVFYIADAFWGVLEEHKLTAILYADTVIYFVAMALSVLLWTRYVIDYLKKSDAFGTFLYYAGYVFFALGIIALVVNFFQPVMFWFDESGGYHAGIVRYFILGVLGIMYLLASVYTLFEAGKTEGSTKQRYLAIGLFGIAMIAAMVLQVAYPLWPFYSMGCLLGTCVLHAFVVEGEKEEQRQALEELFLLEQHHEQELGSTRELAYTDPLTGVKNKHSYVAAVDEIDERIAQGTAGEFAIVVFDLNDLKTTNDTMGHAAGDALLTSACKLICDQFKHSSVFRIGGDEFAAILEGADYANRDALHDQFCKQAEENLRTGSVVVSSGVTVFDPLQDNDFNTVFKRADAKMYLRKQDLKEMKKRL